MGIINIPFSRFSGPEGTRFEYDPEKSASNLEKHGIDFEQAQELWEDENLLRLTVSREGERRFVFVGVIDGKHWSAVVTYRGSRIRIISVRRARKQEVARYDENNQL